MTLYSVPGIADPVRIDVALCVWGAYILACIFMLQFLVSVVLSIRWYYFGGKLMFEEIEAERNIDPKKSGDVELKEKVAYA
jgi:hypothetical protein